MAKDTIVLGAGMVGVSVAYHLARRGRSVLLIDRREPGDETSLGNAGLIQREAVEPYQFPQDFGTLMSVLPNNRIDIRYQISGMVKAAGPLFQYWRNSWPSHYSDIVPDYAAIIGLCLQEHETMIEAAKAQSLVHKQGWFEIFRRDDSFRERLKDARRVHENHGVNYEVLDRSGVDALQPGLSREVIGGLRWTDSWCVESPGDLVKAYADAYRSEGGETMTAYIESLEPTETGWRVGTSRGDMEAKEVVNALGPWAMIPLKPLGYRFPLFAKRGYNMHYAQGEHPLKHWIRDTEQGYFMAAMREGIRITTGAELAGRDSPPNPAQLDAAEKVARKLVPSMGARLNDTPWEGARPCLPDMKPLIGPAPKHKGLWLALGHGHQGFTLGPVTGRLLGEMMDNEPTAIDMKPFGAERFG
ncbi:FAD-binding oxidoreductase [Pistricoccus aurantiacus]|uniref:FAD-binding oxidoreductase n=1 Tax=Pistricoccus aurantiacus TaxID=1883414 RepID=A0A5B8SYP3_9GAMM|nr:FAD-binding oxidoreductase [Pistricoccus aurantiacus]QEA40645.1 FAD-binding oxidoreductase [Pistricoccus aurantiacus]